MASPALEWAEHAAPAHQRGACSTAAPHSAIAVSHAASAQRTVFSAALSLGADLEDSVRVE